jgi:hypothetical protein
VRIHSPVTQNTSALKQQHFEYLTKHKSRNFSDAKQRILYSFNNVESAIIGQVEEEGNYISLYEYRGPYIGTEFLISFSKNSVSYKLIRVVEKEADELQTANTGI